MNCPGVSGEQSPKRMSRELEGRDPCRRESTSRGSQPTSAHAEFVRSKKTVPIAPATVRPTPRSWRSLDAPASRFANSASRRSATPESGRDGAAPTMPESRSWSARPRDCAPPSRNRAKIASSCRNQELRLNSFRPVLLSDAIYGNHESCGAKIRHIVARPPQLAHRLVSESHGVLQS